MINTLPEEFKKLLERKSFAPLPCWSKKASKIEFTFELKSKIYLGLKYPGQALTPPSKTKEFYEGLWNYDLVEAFLSIDNNKYIEINLSINGSWWAASFNEYRKKDSLKPKIKPDNVFHSIENNENLVIASFDYEDISFNGEYNVTAIVDKEYYSLNPTSDIVKPDFHLKELRR